MLGLADPFLKIGRAKKQLESLDTLLDSFIADRPYTFSRYDDLENQRIFSSSSWPTCQMTFASQSETLTTTCIPLSTNWSGVWRKESAVSLTQNAHSFRYWQQTRRIPEGVSMPRPRACRPPLWKRFEPSNPIIEVQITKPILCGDSTQCAISTSTAESLPMEANSSSTSPMSPRGWSAFSLSTEEPSSTFPSD